MEAKFRAMTEQLRLVNGNEATGEYLRWIIQSDTAKEYWESRQAAVTPALPREDAIKFGKYLANTHNTEQWEPEDVEVRVPEIYEDYLHFCGCDNAG